MPKRKTRDQFISDAIVVHGNKYDYSKVVYKNNLTPVIIICAVHGEFKQTPKSHLKGNGCKRCASIENGLKTKLSKHEFIQRAISIHGEFYDYSVSNYINNYTKVNIICPIHGEFRQQPSNHLNGQGCPKCGIKKSKHRNIGENDTLSKAASIAYHTWNSMMDRCYNEDTLKRHPSYKGCTVCDEWQYFSHFEKWFNEHYVEGWQIDKDLLVKGNKEYAPDKCCFLPLAINSFLTNKKRGRGCLAIGVSKSCDNKKYRATLRCLNKPHLGTFDTEIEAFNAYKEAKEARAKEIAEEWKGKIDILVYNALLAFKVEITD